MFARARMILGLKLNSEGRTHQPCACCKNVLRLFVLRNYPLCIALCFRYAFSLLLERRSLLLLREDMYENYLHGIEETVTDDFSKKSVANLHALGDEVLQGKVTEQKDFTMERQSVRLSLTMRHVPKVVKLRLKV